MEILASCSYEESKNYNGKLLIENEEGEKPDKVSLNVVIEDGNTAVLNNINTNVKCVTFKGNVDLSGISIQKGRVFKEYDIEDVLSNCNITDTDDIVNLIRVPNDFCNMRILKELCEKHSSVRIIGGKLLNIEGVRIGRYDVGKDKGSPVYEGVYDTFLEVPLSNINNIKDIVKKARKKLSSESSKTENSSKRIVTKKSNMSKAFNSLFGDIQEEDF